MQVAPSNDDLQTAHGVQPWRQFLALGSRLLGAALLASALITWVAANWSHWHPDTRLLLGQAAVVLASVLAWLLARRDPAGGVRPPAQAPWRDVSPAAISTALAAVATGGLLAMLGQFHQTGADPAWLFLGWAALILPWVWAARTLVLLLLAGTLLNVGLGLWLDDAYGGHDTTLWLVLAALNISLLVLREAADRWVDDPWRVSPRVALAAVAGALWLATLQQSSSQALVIALPAMAGLLGVARWYRGPRDDPGMRATAATGLFALAALLAALWCDDVLEIGLAIVVLLALAGVLMTHVVGRVARAAWLPAVFRYVVMVSTALLLLGLVFLLISPDLDHLPWLGAAGAAAGLIAWRSAGAAHDDTDTDAPQPARVGLRLTAQMLAAAGILLVCGWVMFADGQGRLPRLLVLAAVLVPVYMLMPSSIVRLFTALAGLSLATVLIDARWFKLDAWWNANEPALAVSWVYPELLLFSLAAVGLWRAAGPGDAPVPDDAARRRRDALEPLAWATTLIAQALAWTAPLLTGREWLGVAGAAPVGTASAVLVTLAPLAVLGWALHRQSHDLPSRWLPLAILAVASLGWWAAPAVGLTLAWLLMGHALRRPVLQGLAVALLLGSLSHYYYQLDVPLLYKAAVLALTGAWLLLGGWLQHRRTAPSATPSAAATGTTRGRRAALLAGAALVVGMAQWAIHQHRQILATGQPVRLALAPVDPRSLIQGDYMILRFAAEDEVRRLLADAADPALEAAEHGYVLVRPDAEGMHQPAGVYLTLAAAQSQQQAGDVIMAFQQRRAGRIWLGTDAWFFPEGEAKRYENARLGEFRVAKDGRARLLQLQ